jgi:RNA recognition motif-containing protein
MRLFVGNVNFNATEAEVRKLFEAYGEVHRMKWACDPASRRFRGFCFISMPRLAAECAIASLHLHAFQGLPLTVREADPFHQSKRYLNSQKESES